MGPGHAPGVWKLNSPAFLTKFVLGSAFAGTRSESSHGKAESRRPRKRQRMGQQVHKYENLLNRELHPDKPNTKWVTDISYSKPVKASSI